MRNSFIPHLTHVFVDKSKAKDVEILQGKGIPCISTDYIRSYLLLVSFRLHIFTPQLLNKTLNSSIWWFSGLLPGYQKVLSWFMWFFHGWRFRASVHQIGFVIRFKCVVIWNGKQWVAFKSAFSFNAHLVLHVKVYDYKWCFFLFSFRILQWAGGLLCHTLAVVKGIISVRWMWF